MKITILPKGIELAGADQVPEMRQAVVLFDVLSDIGRVHFEIQVVPEEGDLDGLDSAIAIARRSLARFGTALAAEAEAFELIKLRDPKYS